MKVGTENKSKVIAMVVLAAVAVVLAVRMFLSLGGSPAAAAAPAAPVARPAARKPEAKQRPLISSLDPTLRLDLLRAVEDTKYEGSGRNIFRQYEPPPPPIPKPVAPAMTTPQVSGPPPPPPIDLKFFGFANHPGEPKKIFLASGSGDVFIAKEGDIVKGRYKVLRIGTTSVQIQDLLSNNTQTIPLTQG